MGANLARTDAARERIAERKVVIYSFREPEWLAVCECRYDEARDEMDREDCPFHCDLVNSAAEAEVQTARKSPTQMDDVRESAA